MSGIDEAIAALFPEQPVIQETRLQSWTNVIAETAFEWEETNQTTRAFEEGSTGTLRRDLARNLQGTQPSQCPMELCAASAEPAGGSHPSTNFIAAQPRQLTRDKHISRETDADQSRTTVTGSVREKGKSKPSSPTTDTAEPPDTTAPSSQRRKPKGKVNPPPMQTMSGIDEAIAALFPEQPVIQETRLQSWTNVIAETAFEWDKTNQTTQAFGDRRTGTLRRDLARDSQGTQPTQCPLQLSAASAEPAGDSHPSTVFIAAQSRLLARDKHISRETDADQSRTTVTGSVREKEKSKPSSPTTDTAEPPDTTAPSSQRRKPKGKVNGERSVGLGPGTAELIAMMVGTRSAIQVRSHAQKHFKKQRKLEEEAKGGSGDPNKSRFEFSFAARHVEQFFPRLSGLRGLPAMRLIWVFPVQLALGGVDGAGSDHPALSSASASASRDSSSSSSL
eukprot:CAMPEP_0196757520 /NCGR_PEP_ID=MMETSP1091-20130531/103699_1 /TAXON_ID=302021 /ORGANISM="Rhodomonas sp., Strain CCMP768" /LENGTH=448 /DNA_ID=CAMNT_0042106299 /DNA_START=15 /DNA_END=1363 /DNA_ORIENTATION=-